jgi:hypothetical protein
VRLLNRDLTEEQRKFVTYLLLRKSLRSEFEHKFTEPNLVDVLINMRYWIADFEYVRDLFPKEVKARDVRVRSLQGSINGLYRVAHNAELHLTPEEREQYQQRRRAARLEGP